MKILMIVLIFFVASIFILFINSKSLFYKEVDLDFGKIYIEDLALDVFVADDEIERVRGMSGRKTFGGADGMLFLMKRSGVHGFWMKDMFLSLDIVWLNQNGIVVGVEENVSPKTYPKIYNSPDNVRFVLELPAGKSKKYGLKNGAHFRWEL